MYECNRGLQSSLMAVQEDNERLKEHLDFILKGGNPQDLEKKMVDGLFGSADGKSALFQTPTPTNVFDDYSDF